MNLIFHEMIEGPRFKLEYVRGDEFWRSSIQLHWRWRKRFYWVCLFL